jgi:hypothetical protein
MPALDEDQASTSARSAPAPLLHPWRSRGDAAALAFHASGHRAGHPAPPAAHSCFRLFKRMSPSRRVGCSLRTTRERLAPALARRLFATTSRRVGRAFACSTVCGRRACRSSRGPCGDAGDNPCRRQGDQVVAPGWTGRRLLVDDDHGASGGRRYRGSPYWVAGGVGGPSSSRSARMPERGVRWGGSARPRSGDPETFGSGRRFAPAFVRGCGRRHARGQRARVSFGASVSSSASETLATTRKRQSPTAKLSRLV